MMLKTNPVFLLLSFMLVACSNTNLDTTRNRCSSPENLTDSDLVGAWESGLSDRNDTIVLNADGTYKQFIHVKNISFDEEFAGRWWIEKTPNDVSYLHLEGMHLCVYWDGLDCDLSGGEEYDWYDFCEETWRKMPDEGVFLILPSPEGFEATTYKIRLFSLQKSTEDVTVYDYQIIKP